MSNIKSYKKSDGKTYYKFNAYLGKDPITGKEIRTNRQGFRTKQEARLAYLRLKTGQEELKDDTSFEEVYLNWLEIYKTTVKDSTLKNVLGIFDNHILPRFGEAQISQIQTTHVQDFTMEMFEIMKDFKKPVNYLSLVFDYAVKQKIIDENPCDNIIYPKRKTIEKSNKKKNVWTREELNYFLEVIDELPLQWEAFFRLVAMTGLRRGEALALEWSDLKDNQITISKTRATGTAGELTQSAKTKASIRTIPIDADTNYILLEWKKQQTKIFGFKKIIFTNSKGDYPALSYPLKQLNRLLNRHPNLPRINLHGLRHTHTSLLIQAGVPLDQVMDRLGHEDVSTTLKVYNHVSQEEKDEGLDNFLKLVVTNT